MTFVKQIAGAAAVGVAMLIGSGFYASPVQAGFMLTLMEQGSNVVASGSGTINLADLTSTGPVSTSAFIHSIVPVILIGPTSTVPAITYGHFTVSSNFGLSGPSVAASSGTGDLVGINLHDADLLVPSGYVSGNPLLDNSTFDNQTFSSLGVTPGTYV